jgi:hypothetical protein
MKILWVVGIVFFLAGVGMLTGSFFAWRSFADFSAHAKSVDGVVVDLAYLQSSKGRGTYAPVAEFTAADGSKVHVTGSVSSSSPAYSRGDHLRILYDPANPEHARIDSFSETWFGPVLLAGMGTVFALVGGGIVFGLVRQRKVRGWLAKNGMRVQAKFEAVIFDTGLKVNNRSPWRLTCQWQHPVTAKVYMFRSDPIWFDPTPFVKRDQLDVLVNADNPKQYMVDTSFLPAAG